MTKALIEYKKNRGRLYKFLKGGSFVGLFTTVVGSLNHAYLVTAWGERTAALVLTIGGLISAATPSLTTMLADFLYPDDDDATV